MSIGTVTTTLGQVSGLEMDGPYAGITQFRGIPFAAPPVGQLRWKPPIDASPWEGVRECTSYAPASIQTFFPSDHLYMFGRPETSEDCLYLNITTGAQSPDEKRPVYVWYHDGGQTNGFAHDPRNDPMEYARKGVVFVSVANRLAIFGCLSLPQLSAEQGQSGNYCMMDCLKALQWVRDNIAAFGGDPDNITIGGESGGAAKACALAIIPEAKGMFRRVINESGLNWMRRILTQEQAEQEGIEYLSSIGIDPDTSVDQLREMPVEKLHNYNVDPHFIPGEFVVDGLMFDGQFRDHFIPRVMDIDFLNCVCAGEAEPGVDKSILAGCPHITTAEQFYAHYRRVLGDLYDKYNFETLVPVTDDTAWARLLELSALGLAPWVRSNVARSTMINRIFARTLKHSGSNGHIYTMRFNHLPPTADDGCEHPPVAPHGADNVYASVSLRFGMPKTIPYTDSDRTVADMMNNYLVNFIKNGDPNGAELVYWPKSGDDMAWLDFKLHPQAHSGIEDDLDRLIEEHTRRTYHI